MPGEDVIARLILTMGYEFCADQLCMIRPVV
jgi:hypothetical protein